MALKVKKVPVPVLMLVRKSAGKAAAKRTLLAIVMLVVSREVERWVLMREHSRTL